MPIIRYFVFVGSLLLALLFAADRYLPAPVEHEAAADPDRTIIRITSARSLPDKIVFDTRPTTDVPSVAQVAAIPEEPPQHMREAMAAMPSVPADEIRKEPPVRASAEAHPHPKRSAKRSRRAPERRLAYGQQDTFSGGWW